MITKNSKVKNLIVGTVFMMVLISDFSKLHAQDSLNTEISNELRILSYNIHHANPPSIKDKIDLPAIINVIKNSKADLVALQEVDSNTERSGFGNQAEQIAEALGFHVFFGKAIDFQNGAYGLAILSKFPILKSQIYHLPSSPERTGEPRILTMSQIKLPDGKSIWFANTHLDSEKDHTNRLLQVHKIIEITQKESIPIIIAGDFNAVEKSQVIEVFDQKFTRTCELCLPTIPVINPTKAIDFIAFKPKTAFKIKKHSVVSEHYASDHLPVLAILEFHKLFKM
ncbi:endonuclease/exonuclease/phosphatase family protein [Gelidibacter mesophilus]|uniref:endonuclease/exonuclease/phosphatase family protein n=1 Tax=Gelidibacter mesophilus TaxID=169050 RepID=UPI00041F8DDB|nr:endonuclease/exonuclease/phosphatase family protein [Gelidibacter mesophilus]